MAGHKKTLVTASGSAPGANARRRSADKLTVRGVGVRDTSPLNHENGALGINEFPHARTSAPKAITLRQRLPCITVVVSLLGARPVPDSAPVGAGRHQIRRRRPSFTEPIFFASADRSGA